MPEGPEIRRAADQIARVLVGKTVEQARFHVPRLSKFSKRLSGQTVTAVDTRGKAMLTRFDNGLTLYSHNQLYGRWYVTRRPKMPRTKRQLRVELHTASGSALLYSASDIAVLDAKQLAHHPFLQRIGPDLLDASLSPSDLSDRLASRTFRDRAVGSIFLDQAFVAGLGNYLRSEILFVAGIHPKRRPGELDARGRLRLARETLKVGRRSYKTGGITLVPSLDKQLKSEGQQFERRRFYVYGREGLPCRMCGLDIARISMSSRNVFYCSSCQGN